MWSFYLNGGVEAVIKQLCRDGFQCQMPDGSLKTWQTIMKRPDYIEGRFQNVDGSAFSRQVLQIFSDEAVLVSYYTSDSEQPYLTYHCRRETLDTACVKRKRAGEKMAYSSVVVISRNDSGKVTAYRLPEASWEVALAYNEKGFLVREEICAPDDNGVIEYEWDEKGNLVLSRLTENK